MYLQHFELKEKPFNITPNPQFIFLSKNHKEVFAHLLYGLQSRCGFIEITGEVGAGKTTVLRTLFEQLGDDEFRLAFIFNPSLSADELLLEVCRELGIEINGNRGAQLLPLINNYLLQENSAGRTVVLVIDEAQNLAPAVLEQIRLLSNLETETDKLIQIVLVGQPELAALLDQPNLRQLNQRISVRYHLNPMDFSDTIQYIRHRLQVVGQPEPEKIIPEAALKLIYKHSKGLPRLINILCERALLAAYSEDKETVDRRDVKTAVEELSRPDPPGRGKRFVLVPALFALTSAVMVVTALYFLLPDWKLSDLTKKEKLFSVVEAQPDTETSGSDRIELLRGALAEIPETESFSFAATALAETWHTEFINRLSPGFDSADFVELLKQNGWQWTSFNGSFETLLSIDTPAMLEIYLPGVPGRRYLALTGRHESNIRIAPSLGGELRYTRKEISALYGGKAYFIWKNYLEIGLLSIVGTPSPDVKDIQAMLNRIGNYELPVNGVYDRPTVEAVTRFQADNGIVQDGRVGPLTLLKLYQESRFFNPPRLSERKL